MPNDYRDFSLNQGGPAYRCARRLGLAPGDLRGAVRLSAWLAAICLLPAALLAAIEGTLLPGSVAMPLLGDVAVLARFLLALPALVLIAPDSDMLSGQAVRHFVEGGVVKPGDRQRFEAILADVQRLRDRAWPECLLLALAFLPVAFLYDRPYLENVDSWQMTAGHDLTLAGIWLNYVARTLYLFLALLWVWRLLLWTLLLARACRLDLNLYAAHPDGMGGLGFLSALQQRFSKFAFAGGVVVAGAAANEILYHGADLHGIAGMLLAYVVITTAWLSAPLLVLTPRLVSLKRRGTLTYGALATLYMKAFEAKWLDSAPGPGRRPTERGLAELGPEYGVLTDMNGAYATVQQLAIIPVNRRVLAMIALPGILPMVPVVLMALGIDSILLKLLEAFVA